MTPIIVTCADCGQQNRLPATLPPGKIVICGQCKEPLDDRDDDDQE